MHEIIITTQEKPQNPSQIIPNYHTASKFQQDAIQTLEGSFGEKISCFYLKNGSEKQGDCMYTFKQIQSLKIQLQT